MITATFTQFRNHAASYFDKVEKGETVEIFRNGKPSAVLSGARSKADAKKHWKDARPLFNLGSDIASRMVLEERRSSR